MESKKNNDKNSVNPGSQRRGFSVCFTQGSCELFMFKKKVLNTTKTFK